MKQHDEVFKKAGQLKMNQLLFYNPLLSDDELKFEAAGIADFLDNAFVNTCFSKYEQGVDRNKAIGDMISIFIQKDKTMSDLAQQVDDDYNF